MAYSSIVKPSVYFNTKLYTGNGSTNAQTGVGFKPDFTWLKARSYADSHALYDAVRGVTKRLQSEDTSAEATIANSLTSFNSDGFTLGSDGQANSNNDTYASWNWKANGAGSTNYDGSINSTVSANTTSGFSIVSYTGTGSASTIGHGLGSVPKMIIVKRRTTSGGSWVVYNANLSTGASSYIYLQSANAEGNNYTPYWNATNPTSSVFSIGTNAEVNNSGDTFIAYCFAEKTGFSKFGSYVGNASTDGSFLYTGFKPAFLIFKRADASDGWQMMDNKRSTFNVVASRFEADASSAEYTSIDWLDFVSNGIKIRNSSGGINASGGTFIYLAFAEAPLVGSNNVPCTAR